MAAHPRTFPVFELFEVVSDFGFRDSDFLLSLGSCPMLSPHIFTLRHVWMALAILLGPVIAVLGGVWLVFHHEDWLRKTVGDETTNWLVIHTVSARLALPAIDSDRDAVPDWYEAWSNTDPRDPLSHPQLGLVVYGSSTYGYVDERTHFRYRGELNRFAFRWPPGHRLKVAALLPVLLPPGDNGRPTMGPLELVAQADGSFAVDLLMASPGNVALEFTDSGGERVLSSNLSVGDPHFVGYRLPPLPTTTVWKVRPEDIPIRDGFAEQGFGKWPVAPPVAEVTWTSLPVARWCPLLLTPLPLLWQSLGDTYHSYVLEAARADRPQDWLILDVIRSWDGGDNAKPDRQLLYPSDIEAARRMFPDYQGAFAFRVVPVSPRLP